MPPIAPPYTRRQKLRDRRVQSQALRPFWTALAKREDSPVDIVCMGTSLTEGYGATTIEDRWTARLRDKLRAAFPVAGVTGGQGYISANYHVIGPMVSNPIAGDVQVFTQNGGSTHPSYLYGLGRRARYLSTPGDSLTLTATCSSFDVVAVSGGNNSYMEVSVDGGAPTTFNLLAQNGQLWPGNWFNSGALTPGEHEIVITYDSGTAMYVEGIMLYNGDETKGIRVWEAGHGGVGSSYYNSGLWLIPQTASNRGSFYNIRPDLVIIELQTNDLIQGVSPATTATNISTLIDNIRTAVAVRPSPDPSILLIAAHGVSGSHTYEWSAYVDALWGIAAADRDLAFLDLSNVMGTGDTTSGLWGTDGIHLLDAGNEYWASAIFQEIAP